MDETCAEAFLVPVSNERGTTQLGYTNHGRTRALHMEPFDKSRILFIQLVPNGDMRANRNGARLPVTLRRHSAFVSLRRANLNVDGVIIL